MTSTGHQRSKTPEGIGDCNQMVPFMKKGQIQTNIKENTTKRQHFHQPKMFFYSFGDGLSDAIVFNRG